MKKRSKLDDNRKGEHMVPFEGTMINSTDYTTLEKIASLRGSTPEMEYAAKHVEIENGYVTAYYGLPLRKDHR